MVVTLRRNVRSVEQTARLLLSNAFRYDTWECTAAKKEVQSLGGLCATVTLKFFPANQQGEPVSSADEVNLVLFDPVKKNFLGAGYRCEIAHLDNPIVFQAPSSQLLVVEILVRDERPNARTGQMRVTHWASAAIENLGKPCNFSLRPGNAHLLLLDKRMWTSKADATTPVAGLLGYTCEIDSNPDLTRLMRELVPPGIFVSEAFTKATPQPGAKSFRLLVRNVELVPKTKDCEKELADPHTEWSMAAVAHNGYQQLGNGAEVPLVPRCNMHVNPTTHNVGDDTNRHGPNDSLDSASYSIDSSRLSSGMNLNSHSQERASEGVVALQSKIPLEICNLPIHSATSLVVAIRYRKWGDNSFRVAGFCVFPLCLMPMENRDVRVENLPALRGPFSCEDARMLMVDASTPYGRIPIAVTLTIEYHDIEAPSHAPKFLTTASVCSESSSYRKRAVKETKFSEHERMGLSSPIEDDNVMRVDQLGRDKLPVSSEKEERVPPSGAFLVRGSLNQHREKPLLTHEATTSRRGEGDSVFQILSGIMEELQKVRETQHLILQQSGVGGRGEELTVISPGLLERRNQRLAADAIDLIDLTPRPIAISWRARRAIQEEQQPILHPLKGGVLDDTVPAVGELPASIFGIRFEGITLDRVIAMPENLCVMFCFGPLPYQQIGPMHTISVEKTTATESFKFYSGERAGLLWHEPLDSLESAPMTKFKQRGGMVYLHVYNALEMFYIATARLPLAHFVRPYRAAAAVAPMDLTLERDFTMTEKVIPSGIFPLMCNAGQLHVSLFCVGVSSEEAKLNFAMTATVEEPPSATRLIVAKRLERSEQLNLAPLDQPRVEGLTGAMENQIKHTPSHQGEGNGNQSGGLHWQRVGYFKKQLSKQNVATLPRGIPAAHIGATEDDAELEYCLRFAEKERDEAKSKAIAKALLDRITVTHKLQVVAWRPEVIRTSFQNPHGVALQFFVEVAPEDAEVCALVDSNATSFYLGPRGRTEIALVLRLDPCKSGRASGKLLQYGEKRLVVARLYTEKRELVWCIEAYATLVAPIVDRRYEIFGPSGAEVTKRLFSRVFSSSAFPTASSQKDLLHRMERLCGSVGTSSIDTRAKTDAVVDPITQSYVTAWEEVSITTTIPNELDHQRIEYITLFYDAAMTQAYETWELCVFPCQSLTSREVYWGQTAVLGFPANEIEAMYSEESNVSVEHVRSCFVVRFTPREIGNERLLLHIQKLDTLKKILLTVPVVCPTPTFMQVIELTQEDVKTPVFRRLTFTHRGESEEVFHVHHNYKYQLQINPSTFGLAPGDSQYIALQFDMLSLPPGQLEGRWPMWIFINDSKDKTVESYHLQVVLRAHPVIVIPPRS